MKIFKNFSRLPTEAGKGTSKGKGKGAVSLVMPNAEGEIGV